MNKKVWIPVFSLVYCIHICGGQSESDCKKYCHVKCTDLFSGDEFGPCVKAKAKCSCGLHPAVIIVLTIIPMTIFCLFGVICCKACRGDFQSKNRYNYSHVVCPPICHPSAGIEQLHHDLQIDADSSSTNNESGLNAAAPSNSLRTGIFITPSLSFSLTPFSVKQPELNSYSYSSKYSTYK